MMGEVLSSGVAKTMFLTSALAPSVILSMFPMSAFWRQLASAGAPHGVLACATFAVTPIMSSVMFSLHVSAPLGCRATASSLVVSAHVPLVAASLQDLGVRVKAITMRLWVVVDVLIHTASALGGRPWRILVDGCFPCRRRRSVT